MRILSQEISKKRIVVHVDAQDFISKSDGDYLCLSKKEHKLSKLSCWIFSENLYLRLISVQMKDDNAIVARFGPGAKQNGTVILTEGDTFDEDELHLLLKS